jgi:hypothetical protein
VFGPILLHCSRVKSFCVCYNLKRRFLKHATNGGIIKDDSIDFLIGSCFKPCLCLVQNIPIEEDKCPFLIGTLKRLCASFDAQMKVVNAMGWMLLNRSKTCLEFNLGDIPNKGFKINITHWT